MSFNSTDQAAIRRPKAPRRTPSLMAGPKAGHQAMAGILSVVAPGVSPSAVATTASWPAPAPVAAPAPGKTTARHVAAPALSRRRVSRYAAALVGALFVGVSHAQYVGPTRLTLRTVKQVMDQGRDEEPVRLRGRLVSHEGGDHYTFADASGRVNVEIDALLFPAGRPIDDKQWVEITGELDRSLSGVKVDVKTMDLLKDPRASAAAASTSHEAPRTKR